MRSTRSSSAATRTSSATATRDTSDAVKQRWDEIKKEEKAEKGERAKGLLDGVLSSQPALMEAEQISREGGGRGF